MDTPTAKWSNHYIEDLDRLHVMPVGDSIPHCPAESCYCKPTLELMERPDNSVGAVLLHQIMK